MIKLKPGQRMIRDHIFRYNVSGSKRPAIIRVAVYNAKKIVRILLTEDHLLNALRRFGQGDPANCAGAVCVHRHAHLFPHPVEDVEFVDSRVQCVTAYRKDGFPRKSVVYRHHDDVAKCFDTKEGLQLLLADLRKNGPKTITLKPLISSAGSPNKPRAKRSREDGSRTNIHDPVRPKNSGRGQGLRIFRTTRGPSS